MDLDLPESAPRLVELVENRIHSWRRDRAMPASIEVNARIAKVLVQALGVEGDEITPSATFLLQHTARRLLRHQILESRSRVSIALVGFILHFLTFNRISS